MTVQTNGTPLRHNALLEAGQEIARLNAEIEVLTIQRNAHNIRANRAEEVVRQLEAQLTHTKQETTTLVQELLPSDVKLKADRELADYINAGWTVASEIVNTVEAATSKMPLTVQHYRIVRLIRTAPIEPTPDQPSATETVVAAATNVEAAATPEPAYPLDPAAFPPAHSSIAGLWNALYQMDRFSELVQHWPKLTEYAPRVYAVFAEAGCDMADAVIMKSFRPGHGDDQWTMKIIFRKSDQIALRTRQAMAVAGFERVIARDGREFIFDLPVAWVQRKTITAASMTILDETAAAELEAANQADPDAELEAALRETYEKAVAANPLPKYKPIPTYNPNQGL